MFIGDHEMQNREAYAHAPDFPFHAVSILENGRGRRLGVA
jgi:hypothetical protein